jgi:two-component system chemotaxis response regulator CheY
MKALVVDDSRAIRMIVSQILEECGFEVSEARHGREALAYLEVNPDTELALIDWNAGANEYVMKPFTRAVIEDKLRLVGLAA